MTFADAATQERYLRRMLRGDDIWSQGMSEPNAGSDLASLKTTAVLDGADYIVNGQKCWTTLGHHADWIFCLVRTDPAAKPQRGISLVLVDMKSPGVTVRPTILLDGTHEVNEVWLENVRVPLANRVGDENQGWTYAKYLLGHERVNIAGVGLSKRELRRLKISAAARLAGDAGFRERVARVEIDLLALEYTNLRVLSAPADAETSAIAASILKIRGSEIRQAISELSVEALGTGALGYAARSGDPDVNVVTASYLNLRKLSIFGGSNEIQKNIIAQTLIGL